MFMKMFRKSTSRKRRQRSCLNYQSLEQRQLLAGVTLEVINGLNTALIDGSNANDVAEVISTDAAHRTLTIEFNGQTHELSADSEIERIRFLGRDGDDTFINHTEINATIIGHAGNDNLQGGNGNNRIRGGADNDTITGGDRNDVLRGSGGNDTIDGGKRHDRIFGNEGNDLIAGRGGNDVIDGGAGDDQIDFGAGTESQIAVFAERLADYSISVLDNNRVDVTHAAEGRDTVWRANILRFDDGDFAPADFDFELAEAETESLRLLNGLRSSMGLGTLTAVADITHFAENWTQNVLVPLGQPTSAQLVANHSTETGAHTVLLTGDRTYYSEINAYYGDASASPAQVASLFHNLWRNSSVHFNFMTEPGITEVGLGFVRSSTGWFATIGFSNG